MFYKILKIIGVLILGALGALIFNLFLLPYMLTNLYFEKFQFVKDFKEGKIIVNQEKQVYIQENTAVQDAMQRVEKSIVAIQSAALGLKSGLIATSDGTIITLASSIPADGNFKVFLQGEPVNFKVVKTDPKINLALIKIDKNNLPTVGFVDSDKIKLGQAVFLVAPTSEKSRSQSPDNVVDSRTNRSDRGSSTESGQDNWLANSGIIRQIDQNSIKTNISESKIGSGSPLFNSAGELVGISFIDSEGKISAVPIDKIKELLGL